jgi:broad specificity phosphatase PhoE
MRMLRRPLPLLVILLACAPAHLAAQVTTVILVRHAERVDDAPDSPLSDAGRARAQALADALVDAGVAAIITTQYQRTKQTAEPLAMRLGITPFEAAAGGDASSHARAIAARIRTEYAGSVVLVVGHSNTTPMIVEALGVTNAGEIADAEHDRMYVVVIGPDGVRMVRSRYGEAARVPTPRRGGINR